MTKTRCSVAALVALVSFVGCSNEPVVDTSVDPQAADLAKAAPVTLPPAIKATKTYRCKDNSLMYVTFLDDDVTVMVRDKEGGAPLVTLKAPTAGQPFVAEGYSFSTSGDSVTYSSPDVGVQSCRA